MAFPSTFSDITSAVIAKARLDSTADTSRVHDWINQVYAQVCVETEANQTSTTQTLTAGTSTYTLASSIVRIKQIFVTPVNGVASLPLTRTNLDTILRYRSAASGSAVSNGSVTHYALDGINQLEVYPTPGAADVLTIYYVALPTALSANTDVPIFQEPYASKLLEYGALAEAADFKSDPQEQEYRALFNDWMARFRIQLNRKQGTQVQQFDLFPQRPVRPHDPSTDLGF